jgi:hypothetical protein
VLGSSKPGNTAYAITNVYDVYDDHSVSKDIKEYDFIELLELTTMLGHTELDCLPIRQDKKEEVDKRIAAAKPNRKYASQVRPHVIRNFGVNLSCADSTTLDLVKKFVELLRPERSYRYNSWIELGWCLHNIHNKDNRLLDLWVEFSKQSPRHAREASFACRDAWMKMNNEGLGIGTLRMWAREDNR